MFCRRLFKKKECSDDCPQRVKNTESKSKAASCSEDEQYESSSERSTKSEEVLKAPNDAQVAQEPKPQPQPAPPLVVAPKTPERIPHREEVHRQEQQPQVQVREQVGTPKPQPEPPVVGPKTSERVPRREEVHPQEQQPGVQAREQVGTPKSQPEPSAVGPKTPERVPRREEVHPQEKQPQVQPREQMGTPQLQSQPDPSVVGTKTPEKVSHKEKKQQPQVQPREQPKTPEPTFSIGTGPTVDAGPGIEEVTDEEGKGADEGPQGIVEEPSDPKIKGPNTTNVEIIELDTSYNEEKHHSQAPGTARKT